MMMNGGDDGVVFTEQICAPVLFVRGEHVCYGMEQDHIPQAKRVTLTVWQFDVTRAVWVGKGRQSFPYGWVFKVAPERVRRMIFEGGAAPSTDTIVESEEMDTFTVITDRS